MKPVEQLKKFRSLNDGELGKELADLRRKVSLASLRIQAGKLKDYSSLAKERKAIAQILTLMSEKGRGEENE